MEVTLRNSSLEGVSDLVQIDTGDMRALPYSEPLSKAFVF